MTIQKEARLHEKVVQQIARDSLPKTQARHTTTHKEKKKVAQKINVVLVDDLDGTEANETITFGLDGVTYEIDLNEQNAKELRTRLEMFTVAARRVKRKSGRTASRGQAKAIRQWARENGFEVSSRGNVPAEVVAAYEAAH